jgi:hypothetical protein
MHNLSAALALVDRAQPHLSALLAVPRQTHGGMEGPIFGPRHDAAFTHLVDWVAIISELQPGTDEGVPADDTVKQTLHEELEIPSTGETAATFQTVAASDGSTEPQTLPRSRLQYGAELKAWQPKDPFDPEIFNRATNRQAQSGEAFDGKQSSNRDSAY